MPVFCLATHVAHGFVQQNSDLCVLMALGAWIYLYAVFGTYLHAHFGRAAIDQHPTLLNPRIGLTA